MSPTIHRERGYRFFFFSREEPRIHIHVVSENGEAKYWLEPEIELARNIKLSKQHLQEIEAMIKEHKDEFITAWLEHFSG
jgi:hypothetical protein